MDSIYGSVNDWSWLSEGLGDGENLSGFIQYDVKKFQLVNRSKQLMNQCNKHTDSSYTMVVVFHQGSITQSCYMHDLCTLIIMHHPRHYVITECINV